MMQQSTLRNQQAMMATAKMFSQAASMVQAAGMAKMLKQIAEWEWAEENDTKTTSKNKPADDEAAPGGFDPEALQKAIAAAKEREEEEQRAEEEAEERRQYEEEEAARKKARMEADIAESIKRKQDEQDELERLRRRAEEAEAKLRAIEQMEASKSTPPGWPSTKSSFIPPTAPSAPSWGGSASSTVFQREDIEERCYALAEGFGLDENASSGLARVFMDRTLLGCDLQADMAAFSEHLATSNKPSSLVSMMLEDLRRGNVIHPCRYYELRVKSGNLRPGDEVAQRFHEGLPTRGGGLVDMASSASVDMHKKAESGRLGSVEEPTPPIEKSGNKGTDDALLSIRRSAEEVAARIAASLASDRASAEAAAAVGAGPGGSSMKPQKKDEKEEPSSASASGATKEDAFLSKDRPKPRSRSRQRPSSPARKTDVRDRGYDRDRGYNDRNYAEKGDRGGYESRGFEGRDRGRDRGSDGGFYDRRARDVRDVRDRSRSRDHGDRDRRQRSRSRHRSRSRSRQARSAKRSRSKSGTRGLPKESSIPLAPAESGPSSRRAKRASKWDDETPPPQPAYKPSAMPKALPQTNNYRVLRLQAIQIRSLLGRGGETINDIRRRSGCDIKIHHPPHEPEGTVSIVGNAGLAETLVAQALIMKGCPLATAPNAATEEFDDIPIPAHLVGLFIGTQGAQIKELQRLVGTEVCISVQPPKEPGGLQSIRIVGEKREHARNIIQIKVDAIVKGHLMQPTATPGAVATPGGKGFAGPPFGKGKNTANWETGYVPM